MRGAIFVLAAFVGVAIAGCGEADVTTTVTTPTSAESSAIQDANDQTLEQAQQSANAEDTLQSEVLTKLKDAGVRLFPDAVSKWNFKVDSGECFVDSFFSAAEGPRPTVDYTALYDPAGRGGVVIGEFQGTQSADCIAAVKAALGW